MLYLIEMQSRKPCFRELLTSKVLKEKKNLFEYITWPWLQFQFDMQMILLNHNLYIDERYNKKTI